MEKIYFAKPTFSGADKTDVLAEAEIHFDEESVFAGLKLTGIQIRKSKMPERDGGSLFVTFPAKAVGTGTERRYFDFIRSVEPMSSAAGRSAIRRLRKFVETHCAEWLAKKEDK